MRFRLLGILRLNFEPMMRTLLLSLAVLTSFPLKAAVCDIVCAASDSPTELKVKADFVCDAHEARPTLQKALDESALHAKRRPSLARSRAGSSRTLSRPSGACLRMERKVE